MVERIVRYFEEHNIIVRGLALVLGCFIDALVYNIFCVPNHIVTGGMGGVGIVVNHFTGINPIIFLNISIICTLCLSIHPREDRYAEERTFAAGIGHSGYQA